MVVVVFWLAVLENVETFATLYQDAMHGRTGILEKTTKIELTLVFG